MATVVRTALFTAPTSTGTANFTISGIGTPKAYIIHAMDVEADATAKDEARYSWGVSDGTRQFIAAFSDVHNLSVARQRQFCDDDGVLQLYTEEGATTRWRANHSAFITDGVTLNFTTVQATGILLRITFFCGDDLSAYVGTFESSASADGETTVTDPGFTPDMLFVAGIGHTVTATQSIVDESFSEGVASTKAGFPQACLAITEDFNNADGDPQATLDDRYMGVSLDEDGETVRNAIELTGTDANGFVATTRIAGASSVDWFYLAIKFGAGVDHYVGVLDTPTSTGSASVTAPGFTPQCAGLILSNLTAVRTYKVDAEAGAFAASTFDATRASCHAAAIEDGSATTDTQSWVDDLPVSVPQHDGSAGLTAAFTSFDANGWTLNWSAVLGSARKYIAWAVEEEAVGGPTEKDTTETGTLDLSESAQLLGIAAVADSPTIDATETAEVIAALLRTDSGLLDASETAALQSYSQRADALPVALAESQQSLLFSSRTDSLSATLSESATVEVIVNTADALTADVSEASNIQAQLDRADSLVAGLTEAQQSLGLLSRTDQLLLDVAEVASLLGILNRSDSLAANLSESAALTVALSRTDDLSLALADTAALLALLSRSDALTITETETTQLLALLNRSEALALTLSEAASLAALLTGSDSLPFDLAESSDLEMEGAAAFPVFASDTLSITCLDSGASRSVGLGSDIMQAVFAHLSADS